LSPGEFLLRQGVEEALDDLRAFAEGLKARLGRLERRGVGPFRVR
jgi:chaperonin cofactor prefoldin